MIVLYPPDYPFSGNSRAVFPFFLRDGASGFPDFPDFGGIVEMVSSPRAYVKALARAAGFFLGLFFGTSALFGGVLRFFPMAYARSRSPGPGDITQRG